MNRNEETYYSLPRRESTQSTTYPFNYDGEFDDVDMDLDDEEDIVNRRVKPQFLIDDDDEYQENLELMWAKEEIEGYKNSANTKFKK